MCMCVQVSVCMHVHLCVCALVHTCILHMCIFSCLWGPEDNLRYHSPERVLIVFFFFFFTFYLVVVMCAEVRGQLSTVSSPSTMWVPETDFRVGSKAPSPVELSWLPGARIARALTPTPLCGPWGWNPGPPACSASTFLTELSPLTAR